MCKVDFVALIANRIVAAEIEVERRATWERNQAVDDELRKLEEEVKRRKLEKLQHELERRKIER